MSEDRDVEALIARARETQDAAPERSLVLFQRAVAMAAASGNANLEADAEVGVGDTIYMLPGRQRESLRHFERAAELAPNSVMAGIAWIETGAVLRFLGDFENSFRAYSRAISLLAAHGYTNGEWQARRAMAALLMLQDRYEEAVPHLLRASELALQDEEPAEAADLALEAGRVLLRLNRFTEAAVPVAFAIRTCEELGDDQQELAARQLMAAAAFCAPTVIVEPAGSGVIHGIDPTSGSAYLRQMSGNEDRAATDEGPDSLDARAIVLAEQYERTGIAVLLDEAIELWRGALAATPADQPVGRAIVLSGLGGGLAIRFIHRRQPADVDEAIDKLRDAARLMPNSHQGPRRFILNHLGIALKTRFESQGERTDIEEAVRAGRAATAAGYEHEPVLARFHTNLANSLVHAFEVTGRLGYLDEAVAANRQATSVAEPDLCAAVQANLSGCLQVRFEHIHDRRDIDEAVAIARHAVTGTHVADPERANRLETLGRALQARCERALQIAEPARCIADIDEAVEVAGAAVGSVPPGRSDAARCLTNLAGALLMRLKIYARLAPADPDWRDGEIGKAVSAARAAVAATPTGHPGRDSLLNTLATALRQANLPGDVDETVAVAREAVAVTPVGHRFLAAHLGNLANAIRDRYEYAGARHDMVEACQIWEQATTTPGGPIFPRIAAAQNLGAFAARNGDAQGAMRGYAAAVELLPLATWRGLTRSVGEENLATWTGIASDAAAWAIENGQPERAVEVLEQGRSVLWAQTLHMRTDLDALREVARHLADRLDETRRVLDGGSESDTIATGSFPRGADSTNPAEAGARQRRLAEEWDSLVAQVRNLPGFRSFLAPIPFTELQTAAVGGTVVVVNCSSFRCDALAVTTTGVRVIPLPDLSLNEAFKRANTLLAALRDADREVDPRSRSKVDPILMDTLSWLWTALAEPILKSLVNNHTIEDNADTGRLPRLWWCPTGPLTLLPLHAAGLHGASHSDATRRPTVIDRVISSYTATLGALTRGRQLAAQGRGQVRLLAVGLSETLQHNPLPDLMSELQNVAQHVTIATTLQHQNATRGRVLTAMTEHNWAHLACHGQQSLTEPDSAHLLLHDGPLTVIDIAERRLTNVELAYLSACQTFAGSVQLVDEAIHLAAAFQLAGYPHVIATQWSISDFHAPKVADTVYSWLTRDRNIDASRAAEAVHHAVRALRTRRPDRPQLWAAYIHTGP